jgi:signal transduction histidine kinase
LTRLRERERIGRDLHDSIIQDIYAATLQLEDLSEDVPDEAVRARVLGVADHLSAVITDVRTYIQGLRARELEGRLLSDGMAVLVQDFAGHSGLATTFAVDGAPYRLPDEMANTLLHIAREALSNATKHAHASRVDVSLAYLERRVALTITDNGRGFDPAAHQSAAHHGLCNLRARAEEAGATFAVRSTPGAGTTITASVPSPH